MITAIELRALDISLESSDTRPSYISAASGLVHVGSHIYVVADDELHLGVLSTGDNEPGRLIRLFAGDLPIFNADRKRQKPDLEAIVFIPAFEDFSHGALLALGSASRPNRGRGVLLSLDPQGAVSGSSEHVDMAPLLGPLHQAFADLNIEGVALVAMSCRFFNAATRDISTTQSSVGMAEGVPLCFTDAACQRRSKNRPRGGAKVGHCGAGLRPPGGHSPSGGLRPALRFFQERFSRPFGRDFVRDDSCRRSSRGC